MSITTTNTLVPGQYKGDKTLTHIQLGDSIQVIPRECFQGCTKLKKIIIPSSVTTIDFRAFASSGLKEVVFEENSCLDVISDYAFASCASLAIITLPSNIRVLGDFSFRSCKKLPNTMFIPASIREIGKFAFTKCAFSHVKIGKSDKETLDSQEKFVISNTEALAVKKTSLASLYTDVEDPTDDLQPAKKSKSNESTDLSNSCHTLTSLPNQPSTPSGNSVITIGESAFADSAIETVEFSQDSQLEIIPDKLFEGCKHLKILTLPPTNISIGYRAFYETTIDDKLFAQIFATGKITNIGPYAFAYCPLLKSITIPASVTSLDESVFYCSNNIVSVEFSRDSRLEMIPQRMFTDCFSLEHVTLAPSIISIGESAFFGSGIDSEAFSHMFATGKITNIGKDAFSRCKKLKSIAIPSSVISIGESAFADSVIETVEFSQDSKITNIGRYAFSRSHKLQSITIPSSVTSIGESAFEISYKMVSVEFSQDSQLETIPPFMFSGCKSLRHVTLSPSIISIGYNAFAGSGIDSEAFSQMFAMGKITHISGGIFSRCDNLKSITIPSSVTSIGKGAFEESAIETVEFSQDSQLEIIPDNLFEKCKHLKILTLTPSIVSIGEGSF